MQPGGGAFYGPKIEFVLQDCVGRSWQCGTIQFDLVIPARFDLRYVDHEGARRTPVMLHRALFGSLERFLGVLLEHHGPALPAWLAPVQAIVLPVTSAQHQAAWALHAELVRAGVRSTCEANDSLSKRIAAAHASAIPLMLVLGARELGDGAVMLRQRSGQDTLPRERSVEDVARLCAPPVV